MNRHASIVPVIAPILVLAGCTTCGRRPASTAPASGRVSQASQASTRPKTPAEPESAPVPVPQDYVETIAGSTVDFEMIWVPAGGFWMGRTEVTWNEFLQYCDFEETGIAPPGVDVVTKPSRPLDGTPYDRDWGLGARPAVGMSWNAAKQYCRWLSLNTRRTYRLPTEAEWAIACGAEPEPLPEHAWYLENSDEMTQEVATRAANEHGLHDMLGNLWEYCGNPYDPEQPRRTVLRGGSWKDEATETTPTSRLRFDNDWTLLDPNVPPGVWWIPDGEHLGFRVLRPGPDDEAKNGGSLHGAE